VLGADLLVAGDRLVGGDVEGAPAQQGRGVGTDVGGVGDGLAGSAPHSLGRLPIGLVAEALLQAGVDRLQVDPEGGQQLAVPGLGAWEHTLVDQPVDRGPDRLQVQTVGDQYPRGQVVALQEQPTSRCSAPR
jgi:hypothetical protein